MMIGQGWLAGVSRKNFGTNGEMRLLPVPYWAQIPTQMPLDRPDKRE
jgi:hypothetical protein